MDPLQLVACFVVFVSTFWLKPYSFPDSSFYFLDYNMLRMKSSIKNVGFIRGCLLKLPVLNLPEEEGRQTPNKIDLLNCLELRVL